MARQVQWILVLAQISILMGYVCLAGVWCILGAILNPGLFLPFATGALTLITFIKMKYERLKDLGKRGKDMVLDYLIFLAAARMNKVLLILSNRIEGATRFIADKSKEVLKGPEFTDITNKVVTLGILSSQEIDLRTSRIINMENQIIMNHENSSPDLMVDEIDKIKEELVIYFHKA